MTVEWQIAAGVLIVVGAVALLISITDTVYVSLRRWWQWRAVRKHWKKRRREELRTQLPRRERSP